MLLFIYLEISRVCVCVEPSFSINSGRQAGNTKDSLSIKLTGWEWGTLLCVYVFNTDTPSIWSAHRDREREKSLVEEGEGRRAPGLTKGRTARAKVDNEKIRVGLLDEKKP